MKKLLISLLLLTPAIVQGAQNDPHNPFSIINPTTESIQQRYDEMLTTAEMIIQLRNESIQHIKDLEQKLSEQNQKMREHIKSDGLSDPQTLPLVIEGKITAQQYNESIARAIAILQETQKELSPFLSLLDKPNTLREDQIQFLTNAQKNIQSDLLYYTRLKDTSNTIFSNFDNSQSHAEIAIKIQAYIKKILRNITYLFIITFIIIYMYKKSHGKIDFNFTNYLNPYTPFFDTFTRYCYSMPTFHSHLL